MTLDIGDEGSMLPAVENLFSKQLFADTVGWEMSNDDGGMVIIKYTCTHTPLHTYIHTYIPIYAHIHRRV